MELRILPIQSGRGSTGIQIKTPSNEILFENFIFGKVVGFSKDTGNYLLFYKGKTVEVKSENLLHLNEFLHLKTVRTEKGLHLEIIERSYEEKNTEQTGFTKNSIHSLRTLNEILEPYSLNTKEFDESNFLKILQTFFPEIEWKDDTPWFEWKFEDSRAEGYLGQKNEKKSFYFQFFSSNLGRIVFLLSWEKEDMDDLTIQSFFSEEKTYHLAYIKREQVYDFLNTNGVPCKNFSFSFSELQLSENENTEWIV
ncbi:MAG: hypothetical protein L6Q54_01050 [Leptospiraceae bacterium]|nr:hypothetical protein [Leptospiraceae bacterium]MCK6379826.1 hypothetical protein [Leptospiraceae bacterium]NUM40982.1 hypothetical protein [Leptospiraceae bacterium]